MFTFLITETNRIITDKEIINSYQGKKLPEGWRCGNTTLRTTYKPED